MRPTCSRINSQLSRTAIVEPIDGERGGLASPFSTLLHAPHLHNETIPTELCMYESTIFYRAYSQQLALLALSSSLESLPVFWSAKLLYSIQTRLQENQYTTQHGGKSNLIIAAWLCMLDSPSINVGHSSSIIAKCYSECMYNENRHSLTTMGYNLISIYCF